MLVASTFIQQSEMPLQCYSKQYRVQEKKQLQEMSVRIGWIGVYVKLFNMLKNI